MEQPKDKSTGAGGVTPTEQAIEERAAEATSDETVSDLAETQKNTSGKSSEGTSESNAPSPDGMFDENRGGRADGSDTGGPM
ncbi:MAG: hypothetical protein M3371_03460 [Acidobacteriota bacterium]|nr:hypothetical protein [Acidobacteriota bacterium]